jgi:hypothetical protein
MASNVSRKKLDNQLSVPWEISDQSFKVMCAWHVPEELLALREE